MNISHQEEKWFLHLPFDKDSVLKPLGGAKRGRSQKSEQGTESHSGPKQGVRAPGLPCLSSMGVRMYCCGGDGCWPDLGCRGESPSSMKGQLCVEGDGGEGRFWLYLKNQHVRILRTLFLFGEVQPGKEKTATNPGTSELHQEILIPGHSGHCCLQLNVCFMTGTHFYRPG